MAGSSLSGPGVHDLRRRAHQHHPTRTRLSRQESRVHLVMRQTPAADISDMAGTTCSRQPLLSATTPEEAAYSQCRLRQASPAFRAPRNWRTRLSAVVFLLLVLTDSVCRACVPGRGHYRRRAPRKLTPLVYKQYVPNVSELTLGASGLPEGRIPRHDKRFLKLVPNYSEDIIFRDEEGTGADRVMSQRGKAKLDTLAISVMNQWPGVRLRVTEGWDDSGLHAPRSLHYEGRAVDITTSDRDRSKYGMLARLAVEAGFDWVYYESRFHIHCSVKSESVAGGGRYGGCFSGDTEATLSDGSLRRFDQLRRGDVVKAMTPEGAVVDSEVLLWLDRDPSERRLFHRLTTSSGRVLTMTPGHLLYVLDAETAASADNGSLAADARVTFVRRVIVGDYLVVPGGAPERVDDIVLEEKEGVFAPLTQHGTVLAGGAAASCYAQVDSQKLAHWALAPLRWALNMQETTLKLWRAAAGGAEARRAEPRPDPPASGIHWYVRMLYGLASFVLPDGWMLD